MISGGKFLLTREVNSLYSKQYLNLPDPCMQKRIQRLPQAPSDPCPALTPDVPEHLPATGSGTL
jgi:hypothetical protein